MMTRNYDDSPTNSRSANLNRPTYKILSLVLGLVGLIVTLSLAGNLFEYQDASEIMLIQSPRGSMTWHLTNGWHWQGFGKVVTYPRRGTLKFDAVEGDYDHRMKIQFNDGGDGKLNGSINYEMPVDAKKLTEIHQFYPSQESLESSLLSPALNKSIYLTGPLMSAKESYAEKKTQLIQFVEDQTQNGVYLTQTTTVEIQDDLNPGQTKRVTAAEIRRGTNGIPMRAEEGQLSRFGIRAFNFAIEDLDYSDIVDKQIAKQQEIAMSVQTSIAQARQAEQRALTVKAEGEATAAQAKWEQEAIKAKEVTAADARLQVAQRENEIAEQQRQATLKRADGEATARRRLMEADGALQQRLDAQVRMVGVLAEALKGAKLVPDVQMGGAGGTSAGNASDLINLLTAQTAKQVGLKQSN